MTYSHEVVELSAVTKPPFHRGYGTAAIPAGPSSVFLTRPSQSSATPLTWVDLVSGAQRTVRRFPGMLRAGVADDTGAWLLGTYGLARVSLPELTLVRTVKRGLPDQAVFLYDLGEGLLAVSRFRGASLTLIDTRDGDKVSRRRLPPAEQLERSPEGWWLFSAEDSAALLLDGDTLAVRRRASLPGGRFCLAAPDAVIVAAGTRIPVAGQLTTTIYDVRRERLVRVNRETFEVEATSEDLPGLQRPVAVDPAGVVHVEVGRGLVALDVHSLAVVGRASWANPRWSTWHPSLAATVIVEQRDEHERLHVFRWLPEA